jgi:hypothetical protein
MKGGCRHCSISQTTTQSPLNGVGANTGNGHLHSVVKACVPFVKPYLGSYDCNCVKGNSIQFDITPTEQTRIDNLQYGCYGSALGVTQARVKELLARADSGLQYENEGTRISRLQQRTAACSSDSILTRRPIIIEGCPPLPPPPAPPARACPLTKNQK